MEKLEILVVDDNKGNRASAELLKEDGHKVETAKTFTEAFTMIRENKYDVVLTDLNFPFGEKRERMKVGFHDDDERFDVQPVGYALVLYAVKQGVPYVALVTDTGHHDGPIAATFDALMDFGESSACGKKLFKINESKVAFFEKGDFEGGVFLKKDGSATRESPYDIDRTDERRHDYVKKGEHGFKRLKNWKAATEAVMGQE